VEKWENSGKQSKKGKEKRREKREKKSVSSYRLKNQRKSKIFAFQEGLIVI